MRVVTTLKKFGSSYMITIPRKIRQELDIELGDSIIVDLTKIDPRQMDRIVAMAELDSQNTRK